MNTVLIFLGAGIGGVLRFWVSNGIYWLAGRAFPYGTLFVNISGCFFMGLLFVLLFERPHTFETPLRMFLLIGLLGGYTTFSAFSMETVMLFEQGEWFCATVNAILSVTGCIVFTFLGIWAARHL